MEPADFSVIGECPAVSIPTPCPADPSVCPCCGGKMRLRPKSGFFTNSSTGNRYVCDNGECPAKQQTHSGRRMP